jgi:hypothetical protein
MRMLCRSRLHQSHRHQQPHEIANSGFVARPAAQWQVTGVTNVGGAIAADPLRKAKAEVRETVERLDDTPDRSW